MILLHIEMKGSEVDTLTKSVTEMNVYLLALALSVYIGSICLGEFVFTDHTFPALLHLCSVL